MMSDRSELSEPELKELCTDESLERRGKALETLGMRYAYKRDYRTAKTFLEQAVVVNDQAQDLEWSSTSRQMLGRVLHELGEYDEAITWFSEAITGFQQLLWDRVMAETLHYRALAYRVNGDVKEALADFDAAFAGLLDKDKPVDAAEALTHKAELELHLGWYGLAHDTLGRALDVLTTEPVFDTRTALHTMRIKCAVFSGRDAEGDISQGEAVVTFW
jgi:tetratricopeptide (TPR) repeat protein